MRRRSRRSWSNSVRSRSVTTARESATCNGRCTSSGRPTSTIFPMIRHFPDMATQDLQTWSVASMSSSISRSSFSTRFFSISRTLRAILASFRFIRAGRQVSARRSQCASYSEIIVMVAAEVLPAFRDRSLAGLPWRLLGFGRAAIWSWGSDLRSPAVTTMFEPLTSALALTCQGRQEIRRSSAA
jgi:hypothetical protein